jgi:hypothetical protein
MAAKKEPADDRSLKRLGGGRWQTRDERFTIEPQSGTWVLVDAEQTDELGLPLVRGPFRSLTEAKAAVDAARGTDAPESPLAGKIKDADEPRSTRTKPERAKAHPRDEAAAPEAAPERPRKKPAAPEPPPEPRWITGLTPRDRGRARRLIERLSAADVRDAENVVRQDLTGGVSAVARVAIADRVVEAMGERDEAALRRLIERVVEVLDNGRDEALDVHWRLVDEDGRPIGLTAADLTAATKRRTSASKERNR